MGIDIFSLSGSSGGGGDDEDLSKINIDKDYAKRFEHNKKREALQKLQELKKKGLAGADDSSDEDSDSDDDDAAELVEPEKDLKFYDALVKVKNQDPVLLAKEVKLFEEESDSEAEEVERPKKKKERPMYLKDVNAQHLMEEGPEFGLKHDRKIYNKDQVADIKAFLEAEKAAFGADDDDGEDLIREKDRNGGDDEMEEEDENAGKIEKRLDEFFGEDGNLDEGEKFLKNYLRNQMWVDKEKDSRVVLDDIDVSDDEEALEEQEKYEAEYNFRHEEVEGDRILGHARFTEGSVRIKNSSRKVQRKSKEERMAQAELERKQELKHLKNLKKKEIQEKLEKIRAIAGIGEGEGCKLDADDLEEEFDPEEYDRKMKEVFDVDYYGKEDADPGFGSDEEGDLEKPDFDKEDELLGLPKDWDVIGTKEGFEAARERVLKRKQEVKEPVGDEDEDEEDEEMEGESKRKKKRKMTLKEKVELDKEFEEYYKLDYEDTIGDLKTRFKYRSVKPSKFGLRTEEVLMADDKNLNQYVSLKKLAPYMEKEWKVTYHQKLKKPLILQLDGNLAGKKYESKAGPSNSGKQKKTEDVELNGEANGTSRRSRRRQRLAELKLSRSRLMAYGKIPSKSQKKH